MSDFLYEVGMPILVVVILMLSVGAAIASVAVVVNKFQCSNLSEVTKRKTDFRWLGGCYVEHEGEMLPYDRWILLDVRIRERK
jgi:hypothetical protein